jgi:hypothetical protein
MITMKKLSLLYICLLCSSCATEPTQPAAAAKQTVSEKSASLPSSPSALPNIESVKIGMSRPDVEKILGEPTSITDTASATTVVWVFAPGVVQAVPPPESKNGLFSRIGGIAATVAGAINPIAGVATNVGTQVYNASTAGDQNAAPATQPPSADARIVTIEFRDNKAFSIQRAKPSAAPPAVTAQ